MSKPANEYQFFFFPKKRCFLLRIWDWLEETGRNYPIHIHSANPVGIANMRRIIKRNSWEEIV